MIILYHVNDQPSLQLAYTVVLTINMVRLRISAQKLILISGRDARTYVSVSDRRVSYRFLMHLTIGLILSCAWQLGAVTCQNSQRGVGKDHFYSKQWKSSSNFKAFLWTKKCFERIPSRPEFACKFVDWFASVFQSLQMHCRIFCNLADSYSVKTNQEIMIFTAKKNTDM